MGENKMLIRELGQEEFTFFRDTIYRECGINLSEGKRSLVQARLMRRMRELKLPDYGGYLDFLKSNYRDEVINFINCITTNKTEFFREPYHFDFLKDMVFPRYGESGKKKIRIWSAGCSTGEEPYTIAITLLEYFDASLPADTKILATDIDTNVLATALRGVYSDKVTEDIPAPMLKKYFQKGMGKDSSTVIVKQKVKDLISFRRLNLLADTFPMKGKFDIIFCRNVVIYFNRESQIKLLGSFHRYLDDEGYLLMGHSETLHSVTDDFLGHGRSVYRKV